MQVNVGTKPGQNSFFCTKTKKKRDHTTRKEERSKRMRRLYSFLLSLVVLTTILLATTTTIHARETDRGKIAPFDTDIKDDCIHHLHLCQSDLFPHIFLQCPKSCAAMLESSGMIGNAPSDDELWWEATGSVRTFQGKRISTDRWDGSVAILAIVPMHAGMAVYYYEMMEHLHKVFSPHVETVLLPIDVGEGNHIKIRQKPGVIVLEEESPNRLLKHPLVKYLTNIKPTSGTAEYDHMNEAVQMELDTDRPTFYIISADGWFIERLISPTMKKIKKRTALFLKTIDYADAEMEL